MSDVSESRTTETSLPQALGLSIRGVSHGFKLPRGGMGLVLDDISFGVGPSEFVSVMGPSGCGKSTLLSICAGFIRPLAGSITWNGEPISGPGRDRGVVFQSPALYPWLNVRENILFGPKATGRSVGAIARSRELLAEMGLEGFEFHRPYELSGGMQHRVALARTLVNEPAVLLMDEPFAALDAQTRSQMQALLLRLWQQRRSTVMFVTHDIEEGLLLADRAVILSHRPGAVKAIIDVPIRRPRNYELVLEREFVELRKQVRSLLIAGG